MRKTFITFLVLFSFVFSLISCAKKDFSAPKSKSQLLTRGPWYFSSFEQKTDNNPWIDNSISLPTCGKDNFFMFQINNVFVVDEGRTKCSSSDPQINSSPWRFEEGNTKIIITLNTVESSFTIEQLDESALSYWTSFINGGITYYTRYTYHR
jgi:hypothetical protein